MNKFSRFYEFLGRKFFKLWKKSKKVGFTKMNYGSREQNLSELGVNDTSYSNRTKELRLDILGGAFVSIKLSAKVLLCHLC